MLPGPLLPVVPQVRCAAACSAGATSQGSGVHSKLSWAAGSAQRSLSTLGE